MPDVDDAAPPRRKVRRREKERRPQRSLSAEPVKSLSDGEAAPAQTPLPRTPAAALTRCCQLSQLLRLRQS